MSIQIDYRLENVEYQIKKQFAGSLTDEEVVEAVRSIYDAIVGLSDRVGIRTTATGSSATFTLAAGSNDALSTLGWTAGTYIGSDATFDDATPASHNGEEDLPSGFDWASTNQDFTVNGTTVNLTSTTTDVNTVVTEINNALSSAGVTGIEAFIVASIPDPAATLPTEIMGVTIDWDPSYEKFVLEKGSTILRDNLIDKPQPHAIDMGSNDALKFNDDEYFVLSGGIYNDELLLLNIT